MPVSAAFTFARALRLEVDRGSTPIALKYNSIRPSITSLFSCCACLRVERCALATKSAAMKTSLDIHQVKEMQSPFPRRMAHRAAPISVSNIALGHASANAVKATAEAGPLVAPQV